MIVNKLFIGKPQITGEVTTSMNRSNVSVMQVLKDKIIGDDVSNTKHHGGKNRVIHQYPEENYGYFENEFLNIKFSLGCLGENITSKGMTEEDVCIGDIYQIGSVEAIVTEPRKPCWTIDYVLKQKGLAKKIQESCKTGWFYRVLKEGDICQGDKLKLVSRPYPRLCIKSCVSALLVTPNPEILNLMIKNPVLSENWKNPASRVLLSNKIEDDSLRLKQGL